MSDPALEYWTPVKFNVVRNCYDPNSYIIWFKENISGRYRVTEQVVNVDIHELRFVYEFENVTDAVLFRLFIS